MITDHGVRTLYVEALRRGYNAEIDGNYETAVNRYKDALSIAKAFDDEAGIRDCNSRIANAKKLKEKDDSLTF